VQRDAGCTGCDPEGVEALAKQATTVKGAAETLGVSAKWIRRQIAAGLITPPRQGKKQGGRFLLSDADIDTLRARANKRRGAQGGAVGETAALARISRLEADRTNLLAQVAWARAIVQEQQKALDAERERSERLIADVAEQRERIEALKALSALDRLRGRHKSI